MTTLVSEDPGRAALLRRRFSARQRVAELRRRLAATDPGRHPHAHSALAEVVRGAADRLADIESELAGEVIEARPDEDDGEAARHQIRQRLIHLQLVLLRVPAECEAAASSLRLAVDLELRRLDAVERRGRCD